MVARSSFTAVSADKMEQPNIKENTMAKFTLHVNKALRSKVTVKGLKDEETPDFLPQFLIVMTMTFQLTTPIAFTSLSTT
jgi:hypothetical protein